MSTGFWVVVVAAVAALVIGFVVLYNAMISSRNRVDEAWSGIDVQLKRRHDLVPSLVDAVRGYASHERTVFERTTEARAQAMSAVGSSPEAESRAESGLSQALAELRAVAEAYPDLRATENFQQLQRDLNEIEDEIQASRRIYNSNARSFNTKIQVFPNLIVAAVARFEPREYFEIVDPSERESLRDGFS
jgi:LemA protein